MLKMLLILAFSLTSVLGHEGSPTTSSLTTTQLEYCHSLSKEFSKHTATDQTLQCEKMVFPAQCQSVKNLPIYYYQKEGNAPNRARILIVAGIHGDEAKATGEVAQFWIERLERIDPRNTWRVIPLLNPDGKKNKTRMNENGIDLNRNFPTADWDKSGIQYWNQYARRDPRRFPGLKAASEPETQCLISQVEEFNPDLVMMLHTPYGVLDFDGPPVKLPSIGGLPWRRLGNFPGSFGRYMWVDRKKAVLTVEFKGTHPKMQTKYLEKLQDVTGDLMLIINRDKAKINNAKRSE